METKESSKKDEKESKRGSTDLLDGLGRYAGYCSLYDSVRF